MNGDEAYGLWPLVVLNTGLFIIFAARFGPVWVADAAVTPRFVPRLPQLPPGGTAGVGEPTAPTSRRRAHSGSEV